MKLINAPLIENPNTKNQLVAMVAQDMTLCLMRLESFVGLIAASKDSLKIIEEAVKKKLDEIVFEEAKEAIERALEGMRGEVEEIGKKTQEAIDRLQGEIDGNSGDLSDLRIRLFRVASEVSDLWVYAFGIDDKVTSTQKDISDIKETLKSLDERVTKLEQKVG